MMPRLSHPLGGRGREGSRVRHSVLGTPFPALGRALVRGHRDTGPGLSLGWGAVLRRRLPLSLLAPASLSPPSFTLFQPHGPPCCSPSVPGLVLSQGLCMCCAFCLEQSSPDAPVAPSLFSFRSLLRNRLPKTPPLPTLFKIVTALPHFPVPFIFI